MISHNRKVYYIKQPIQDRILPQVYFVDCTLVESRQIACAPLFAASQMLRFPSACLFNQNDTLLRMFHLNSLNCRRFPYVIACFTWNSFRDWNGTASSKKIFLLKVKMWGIVIFPRSPSVQPLLRGPVPRWQRVLTSLCLRYPVNPWIDLTWWLQSLQQAGYLSSPLFIDSNSNSSLCGYDS